MTRHCERHVVQTQLIVDELPNGSEVEDLTASAPFACAEGGVFFTGHWFVTPPQGFDTREFIETLPSTLSYDFAVEPTEVPTSYPSVCPVACNYTQSTLLKSRPKTIAQVFLQLN